MFRLFPEIVSDVQMYFSIVYIIVYELSDRNLHTLQQRLT